MNLYSKKGKRTVTIIIVAVLVLAMVIPLVMAAFA